MRLTQLHLAGFKSFVDPTDVRFPSNLVGVVGPNGCGKSNLIDAIRWVMGESSARQLRGQALEDVIFSGASGRKPASVASVELVFDNNDGRLGDAWTRFSEISVRRELGRDGQSRFFLNNTRCRRRDITDLFLGTGLGARSYSIIEQGQVNRIVEARPEELRAYLEEAAGISRYRERRRETEQRMAHTRENLERLTDLREELDRQLARLDRQAKTAARYRRLRAEARETEGRLLALELSQASEALAAAGQTRQEAERQADQAATERAGAQVALEAARRMLESRQQETSTRQAAVYEQTANQTQVQVQVDRLRADREQRLQQQQRDERRISQLEASATELENRLATLERSARDLQAAESQLEREREQDQERLKAAETQLQSVQAEWDAFMERASEPAQRLARESRELTRLEQAQAGCTAELERIDLSRAAQRLEKATDDLKNAESLRKTAEEKVAAAEQQVQQAEEAVNDARVAVAAAEERLGTARAEVEALLAEKRALEQVIATENHAEPPADGMTDRLVERLAQEGLNDPWLEYCLGSALNGWTVDRLEDLLALGELPGGQWWIAPHPEITGQPDCWLKDFLDSRHRAADLPAALAARHDLPAGHALVTDDGVVVGRHWLRMPGDEAGTGMLPRRAALKSVLERLPDAEQHLEAARANRSEAAERLARQEQDLRSAQAALRQTIRTQGESEVNLTRAQSERAQAETAEQAARQTRTQTQARQAELQDQIAQGRLRVAQAEADRDATQAERAKREQTRRQAQTAVQEARQALEQRNRQAHEQALESSRLSSRIEITRGEIQRNQGERRALAARQQEHGARLEALGRELAEAHAQETVVVEALEQAREALADAHRQQEEAQAAERVAAEALQLAERRLNERADAREQARMADQEARLRHDMAREKYQGCEAVQEGFSPPLVESEPADALRAELDALQARIRKLGNVNLSAIEEFEQARARKETLDAQDRDLNEALAQLTSAIERMDRETRARFRETFGQVNDRLGPTFARLFGGGEALLTLEEDDLLHGGVHLMSRPPGKRVSHLSLLSGGEKALTAVALIFAIFSLNPAPFCILDELDAPLDEANVGRFCAMVREMSEQVQFVFITHNKTTMEHAAQLIGVTMREPGVSRVVSVDLDQAVQMVDSES
ncbi:MAG: chromosome segregation protein SMC [Halothiobacillaceae bacterium]